MIALRLEFAGQLQQRRHRRQEDARRLPGRPRAHEPTDRLGEEQRRGCTGGVDADRQSGHVHSLGDHPHRHQPATRAGGELVDPRRGSWIIGEHQRRRLAGDGRKQRGVGPGGGLVGGDHHGAGIRHSAVAQLAQPGVGGTENRRHPLTFGIQCRPPGPRRLLDAQWLTESGGELLAGVVTPAGLPGVGQEDHRAHHPVGQGFGVAVGVVGRRAQQALLVGGVGDEWDRTVVAAERGSGESEPTGRVGEGLSDALAPAFGVAPVVNLVEDHERSPVLGAHPVPHRMAGDLGIGDHDAVVVVRCGGVGIGKTRIQRDSGGRGGRRPLDLEVFGGHHDGDSLHGAVGESLGGDPQGERRFACSRGGDQ